MKTPNNLFAEMVIKHVISKILVLCPLDESPTKTELADMAKENTEMCDITQAKPQ